MQTFKEELEKDINKIVGVLKDENELKEILKKRLTKKEFKYYSMKIDNIDEDEIRSKLKCDIERFEEIKKHTILKLNQEKLKYELIK